MTGQLSFFGEGGQSKGLPNHLLDYKPGIFDAQESDYLLHKFITETSWKQSTLKLYDKEVVTPRLTAWFGDVDAGSYLTERITNVSPWKPELLMIKAKVEALAGMQFNSVLLNYYRDGNDSVAWHRDKESTPGRKTIVASVSFGQLRSFDIRNRLDHSEKYSIKLAHGSYLLMKAGLQDDWEHRMAKSNKPMKARVNLTFRLIG